MNSVASDIVALGHLIKEAATIYPKLLREAVIPTWLNVLERILARSRSECTEDFDNVFQTWRMFGVAAGVKQASAFRLEATLVQQQIGGHRGCGWFKCPLYDDPGNAGKKMMRCTGCESVSTGFEMIATR